MLCIRDMSPITAKCFLLNSLSFLSQPFFVKPLPPALPSFTPSQDCLHLQRLSPRGGEVKVGRRVGSPVGNTCFSPPIPGIIPGNFEQQSLNPHHCCCGIELWWQMTVVTSLKKAKQLARPGGCAPNLCPDTFVVHNGIRPAVTGARQKKKKKKSPSIENVASFSALKPTSKFASMRAKRLHPTVLKKAHTHRKADFKADHTCLMNSERLLPSPGWSVYRINL